VKGLAALANHGLYSVFMTWHANSGYKLWLAKTAKYVSWVF